MLTVTGCLLALSVLVNPSGIGGQNIYRTALAGDPELTKLKARYHGPRLRIAEEGIPTAPGPVSVAKPVADMLSTAHTAERAATAGADTGPRRSAGVVAPAPRGRPGTRRWGPTTTATAMCTSHHSPLRVAESSQWR